MGGPLALEVTPPAGGHIRAGSTVGLRWSPATDDLSGVQGNFVSASDPGQDPVNTVFDLAAFVDAQGQLTLPSNTQTGEAIIHVRGRRVPRVTRCEAGGTCDLSYDLSLQPLDVPVTVEP
jgi:hypothetical protein